MSLLLNKSKKIEDRYDYLVENFKEGKILDIGNIGGVYGQGISNSSHLRFKKEINEKSILYGVDLFDPPQNVAHLFTNQYKVNAEDGLPFKNEFFDTVYCGQILEHISNPNLFLLEINRVLKKSGVFILDIPNPYAIERLLKWLLKREEDLGDPTHLIFYTPASLKSILEHSKFFVQDICTDYKQRIPLPSFIKNGLGSHILAKCTKDEFSSF